MGEEMAAGAGDGDMGDERDDEGYDVAARIEELKADGYSEEHARLLADIEALYASLLHVLAGAETALYYRIDLIEETLREDIKNIDNHLTGLESLLSGDINDAASSFSQEAEHVWRELGSIKWLMNWLLFGVFMLVLHAYFKW